MPDFTWGPWWDDLIRDMAKTKTAGQVSDLTGIREAFLWEKARAGGFAFLGVRAFTEPTYEVWAAAVAAQAEIERVSFMDIMRGNRSKPVTVARWKAWRAVLAQDERYSIKGVAACSGYDHTTILYSLARLAGMEARDSVRTSRASGRLPASYRDRRVEATEQ